MRDDCYQAKLWLNRNYYSSRQLAADRRMLAVIENLLGSGVARYENDGTSSGDADAARARHEDKLLEYSEQKERVEREERELITDMARTRRAIDRLEDEDHKAVAIERYINLQRWNDIADLMHISRAGVFRVHEKMLEKMAEILRSGRFD